MSSRFDSVFALRHSYVHEVCGPGALGFAAIAAAQLQGPVLWVREQWVADQLHPVGFVPFIDPRRLLVAQAADGVSVLAITEEALRDGVCPFVIFEVNQPLSLKAGRRLQLAAGATSRGVTGLCVISEREGMGSNAAFTRWHISSALSEDGFETRGSDSTLMLWRLIKNKTGTLGGWHVRWDHTTRCVSMVSPLSQ